MLSRNRKNSINRGTCSTCPSFTWSTNYHRHYRFILLFQRECDPYFWTESASPSQSSQVELVAVPKCQFRCAVAKFVGKTDVAYAQPSKREDLPPQITATSAVIEDVATKTVLFQRNADEQLPAASTQKWWPRSWLWEAFTPNTVLTVQAQDLEWSNVVGLEVGEQLTVEDILKCLLIASSNESAELLAREYPGDMTALLIAWIRKLLSLVWFILIL